MWWSENGRLARLGQAFILLLHSLPVMVAYVAFLLQPHQWMHLKVQVVNNSEVCKLGRHAAV